MTQTDFIGVAIGHSTILQAEQTMCLVAVHGLKDGLFTTSSGTHTIINTHGSVVVTDSHGSVTLTRGMFAVIPGTVSIDSLDACGIVISAAETYGFRQFGGPIEATGRLNYIDGCTDTLLICPSILGAPCLNHLHIPPKTNQTFHTHPSDRIGVIMSGSGWCDTLDGTYPLLPGLAWFIPAGSTHRFRTAESAVDVAAWHPDSDFGPTDTNHPMINRTVI